MCESELLFDHVGRLCVPGLAITVGILVEQKRLFVCLKEKECQHVLFDLSALPGIVEAIMFTVRKSFSAGT
jgi:hypothetical protein